jgi:uncharacterized membrane protein
MRARASIAGVAAILFVILSLLPPGQGVRVAPFDRYGGEIRGGAIPYRDFSLEYPPGALGPIAAPAFVPGVSYTAAFRVLEAMLGGVTVVCVALVRWKSSPARLGAAVAPVALAPLLLGPMITFRYDLWPTALVLAAFVAVCRRRPRTAGALVGIAIAAKLYPVVLVLPLALALRTRQQVTRAVTAGVIGFLVVVGPFLVLGPGGVRFSLTQQGSRHLQLESIPATLVALIDTHARTAFESGAWDIHGSGASLLQYVFVALGLAAVGALWLFIWNHRETVNPVGSAAALVAVVLVCSNVLSPQYLVWLVPLVAAAGGARAVIASGLLAVAEVLTRFLYPGHYDALVALHGTELAILALRNLLLVGTAFVLVASLRPRVLEPANRAHVGEAEPLEDGV